MYLSPRKKLFFAMPALVLVLAVFLLFRFQRDEHLFVSFCQELFATEMQGDTLAMHYHIRHPEDFQIYSYEPTLPVYQAGSELSVPVRLEIPWLKWKRLIRSIFPGRMRFYISS